MHLREETTKNFNIQKDIDNLRDLFRQYRDIEQNIICSNPAFGGADVDNLTDFYKWLPFPVRDGMLQTPADLCLSDLESWPAECLAVFLADILKNQVSSDIQVHSVGIDTDTKSFAFCISGSVTSEGLQNLFWQLISKHYQKAER